MTYKIHTHTNEEFLLAIGETATLNDGHSIRLEAVKKAESKREEGGTCWYTDLTTGLNWRNSISADTPVFNDVRRQLADLRGTKTQAEVAEAAKLSTITISRVENMTQSITTDKLERWLNAIGYTLMIEKL